MSEPTGRAVNDLIHATHPNGSQSKRSYTRAEIAAARRRGLVSGKENSQTFGGPLYWATGDWHPEEVRKAAQDYAVLRAAIEREWAKEKNT